MPPFHPKFRMPSPQQMVIRSPNRRWKHIEDQTVARDYMIGLGRTDSFLEVCDKILGRAEYSKANYPKAICRRSECSREILATKH